MDPERLTAVLRGNGHLGNAIVTSVELTPLKTNGIASDFYTARLRYSSNDHRLPERMVIKRPRLGDRGRGEADVYERVLGRESGLPLIGYFGVLDEGPDQPLSLLFEDLSTSHHQPPWPIIPGLADCERAVAALASIHGHWWGRADSIGAPAPPVAAHQDAKHLATFFPDFVAFVGEYLSADRIEHYERVFSNLDALMTHRIVGRMSNWTTASASSPDCSCPSWSSPGRYRHWTGCRSWRKRLPLTRI